MTDKHGTIYTYGGSVASNPNTPSTSPSVLVDPGDSTGCRAFRWGLSSVQDTFGNLMTISYLVDSGNSPGGQEPFTALYPKEIDYTAHVPAGSLPSTTPDLPAPYKVLFALDARGTRPDALVNGRPGFQERIDFRLDHIDVQLQTGAPSTAQIIRRYQLAYANDVPGDASTLPQEPSRFDRTSGAPFGLGPAAVARTRDAARPAHVRLSGCADERVGATARLLGAAALGAGLHGVIARPAANDRWSPPARTTRFKASPATRPISFLGLIGVGEVARSAAATTRRD